MTEQLRADLEALYEYIDQGWRRYGDFAAVFGLSGGCLGQSMNAVALPSCAKLSDAQIHAYATRMDAMAEALGFAPVGRATGSLGNGGVTVDICAIAAWNDQPSTTWDVVRERVKDAIGRL